MAKSKKEKVIITGSSGLVGKSIIEALQNEYTVLGLDIESGDLPNQHFYQCDLTDNRSVSDTLQSVQSDWGAEFASCIHLAAFYDFSGEPNEMYEELTVQGSKRLAQGLQNLKVEQLIFSSSILVMKPVDRENGKMTAESTVDASWPYPQSKLDAEQTLKENRGSIPLVILRIAGVYDDNCHSLPLSQHIRRIYEKEIEASFFPGDSDCGQAYIHRDDLAQTVKRTVEKRSELPEEETFLIAEPDIMSHCDLQEEIGRAIHGKAWPTFPIPKPVAKAGAWIQENILGQDKFIKPWMVDLADDHYPVDLSRVKESLNWEPERSLRNTLPRMLQRLKQNPQKWFQENGLEVPKRAEQEPREQSANA